jgi:hypothetical protein
MINIDRRATAPDSLTTDVIKQYIQAILLYMENTENKDKPKQPVNYRQSDLLEAFEEDFHSKCYLTEQKFFNANTMDIEHFTPQSERPDLVYEWTNLFPAEHHANMMKPRKTPIGGYLNPCEPLDDVEAAIKYALDPMGFNPYFEAIDPNNPKAVNTAGLLERLHNGHNNQTRKTTKVLEHAIHKKYVKILQAIIEYRSHADDSQEQFQAQITLKQLLSRKSSFTMLCRSMPAVQNLPAEFFD